MIKGFLKNRRIGALPAMALIAAIVLFALTGCGALAADVPTATPTDVTQPPDTSSPAPAASAAQGEEPYYGQWTVRAVVAYGSAGTYGKEDAEKCIGYTVSFAADKAEIINDQPSGAPIAVVNPTYRAHSVTGSEFLEAYRIAFDSLGLAEETVAAVEIAAEGVGGCTLLRKDGSTWILVAGGTCFELTQA